MFLKALTGLKGDEKKINVVYGKLQIGFFGLKVWWPKTHLKRKGWLMKDGISL